MAERSQRGLHRLLENCVDPCAPLIELVRVRSDAFFALQRPLRLFALRFSLVPNGPLRPPLRFDEELAKYGMGCAHSVTKETAVYMAAEDGRGDDIHKILRSVRNNEMKRIILEWEDEDGKTPIMKSLENGHEDATLALLQHGVNVNYVSAKQGTVLLAAMKAENFALVYNLLERGASPFLKNVKGTSAWEYALENSRNAPLLREFERYGCLSGLLRFPVPVVEQGTDGRRFSTYEWRRLWTAVVPEYLIVNGSVYLRRKLYVFRHSMSFTPMCIAELSGAQGKIIKQDKEGTIATLDLSILPYEMKGIASVVAGNTATLCIKEFHQDYKYLITFLEACMGTLCPELSLSSPDSIVGTSLTKLGHTSAKPNKSCSSSSLSLP